MHKLSFYVYFHKKNRRQNRRPPRAYFLKKVQERPIYISKFLLRLKKLKNFVMKIIIKKNHSVDINKNFPYVYYYFCSFSSKLQYSLLLINGYLLFCLMEVAILSIKELFAEGQSAIFYVKSIFLCSLMVFLIK